MADVLNRLTAPDTAQHWCNVDAPLEYSVNSIGRKLSNEIQIILTSFQRCQHTPLVIHAPRCSIS